MGYLCEDFNPAEHAQNCINRIKKWYTLESGGARGIVIGISGGKDSFVTAKLFCEAIGKNKVLGVLMPNGEQPDIADSLETCELLDITYHTVNIANAYNALIAETKKILSIQCFLKLVAKTSLRSLRRQSDSFRHNEKNRYKAIFPMNKESKLNIAPRLRMTTLYAIAQTLGYRVAGTGNLSERYIGYCTKWGDMASDFAPIANLTSDEVIAIGDYLGLPRKLVHKTPADGLSNLSDEEKIGFTYEELNKYIRTGVCDNPKTRSKIDEMHARNLHKTTAANP